MGTTYPYFLFDADRDLALAVHAAPRIEPLMRGTAVIGWRISQNVVEVGHGGERDASSPAGTFFKPQYETGELSLRAWEIRHRPRGVPISGERFAELRSSFLSDPAD